MTFGLLLMALIGMDSHSYVAPDNGGYISVLADHYLGWDSSLVDAERRYRLAITERRTLDAISCVRAEEIKMTFDHLRPDGRHWSTAMPFGATGLVVEILATGPNFPTILRAWHESPSHEVDLKYEVQEFGFCQTNGNFAAHGAWPVVLSDGEVALVTGQNLLIVIVVILLLMVVMLLLRTIKVI